MVKGQTALDMRGRCSAGQKVSFLHSLAIITKFLNIHYLFSNFSDVEGKLHTLPF